MEEQLERDFKLASGPQSPNASQLDPETPVRVFYEQTDYYSRRDIESKFKGLMERLAVYIPETSMYQLSNSKIIAKVFQEQIHYLVSEEGYREPVALRDDELWDKLIRLRCRRATRKKG